MMVPLLLLSAALIPQNAISLSIFPTTTSQYSVVAAALNVPLPKTMTFKIGTVSKNPNPMFVQDKPWEPRLDNGYPNIIQTATGYECFYGDCVKGCGKQLLLYANSTDGITWNKPNLGIYDLQQVRTDLKSIGTDNNIVMYGGGIGIFRDDFETNKSKLYKAFGPGCYGHGGNTTCTKGGTATSPDGLKWNNKVDVNWPSPHRYDTHTNAFWDEQQSKYVVTTRDGFSQSPGRTIGIAVSETKQYAWNVSEAPPVVEEGSDAHQLYSQITFPWLDNAYLGIVSVFDTIKPSTFGYGKVHCRLVISENLQNWTWVDVGGLNGRDFIPHGAQAPTNSFDSHICFAAARPLQMSNGSARIYYMGGNGPHNGQRNSSLGLATLQSWHHFAGVSGMGTITLGKLLVTGRTLCITVGTVESGEDDGEVGGYVQIGTNMDKNLLPELSTKIVRSAEKHPIAYTGAGADYSRYIGKEIELTILIKGAFVVYTVSFEK
jgi:hypothetical protein